jgi:hypothetical protein
MRPDPELDSLIASGGPYDAVTLWFTGIHSAREHDQIMVEAKMESDEMHRRATDLAALEYAANFVRPGGCFHVVSRFAGDEPALLHREAEEEMRALAEHGPVQLLSVQLFQYNEPTSGLRIIVGGPAIGNANTFAASAVFGIIK